jgi:probable phosphoglycerate mutase
MTDPVADPGDRAADATGQRRVFRQSRFRMPPEACELVVVRHGESQPAVEGVPFELRDGHGDPPLADEGREQAERLAERLAGERIDAIYVTSLRRTHETAAPTAAAHGLVPVEVPELREVYLGEWEGELLRQKVADGDPIATRLWTEERWDLIPGAESHEELEGRVVPALQGIAEAHPDGRVMVVVHGGVIASILHHATGSRPFAFLGADNASISHLVIHGDRWILRRFNDTGHLDGELSPTPDALT